MAKAELMAKEKLRSKIQCYAEEAMKDGETRWKYIYNLQGVHTKTEL